ncbi:hypothetical protein OG762_26370 [Streptomyces sp. NBC_01136]|uniref:hypothetical protein n=1 Tax=unclassified Streptomyces TaxID=2593676 RepID=UPI00324D147B|nr:hypothetical protein OG762_26370 [Streptomyces sp. NBC_01136]
MAPFIPAAPGTDRYVDELRCWEACGRTGDISGQPQAALLMVLITVAVLALEITARYKTYAGT